MRRSLNLFIALKLVNRLKSHIIYIMNQLSSPQILIVIQCTLCTVHYTLHTVHCKLYNLQSTLKTVHCICLSVRNILYPISISYRWWSPLVLLMCIYLFMRWTTHICCDISYTLNSHYGFDYAFFSVFFIWWISWILSISSFYIIYRQGTLY